MKLHCRGLTLDLGPRPLIIAPVRLHDVREALSQARQYAALGADIVELHADHATSPVGQFVTEWQAALPVCIATPRHDVAHQALAAGAHLLNGLGILPNPDCVTLCLCSGAAWLVSTRSQGKSADSYGTLSLALADGAAMPGNSIAIDSGIDIASADNPLLSSMLKSYGRLGVPVLADADRGPMEQARAVAGIVHGMLHGIRLFRTRNVREAALTVRTIAALEQNPQAD